MSDQFIPSDETKEQTPAPTPEEAPVPGDVKLLGKGRFGKWFDNVWYHYKFQIIASVLVFVAFTVCLVQCLTKPKDPDFRIYYAGDVNLFPTEKHQPAQEMAKDMLADANAVLEKDDARIEVSYYYITSEAGTFDATSQASRDDLANILMSPDGYIFLMSEAVYKGCAFTGGDRTPYMTEVAPYLPVGNTAIRTTEDGHAVYLNSTPLGASPAFADLPEDTLLCLRVRGVTSLLESKEVYPRYENLFRALLAE